MTTSSSPKGTKPAEATKVPPSSNLPQSADLRTDVRRTEVPPAENAKTPGLRTPDRRTLFFCLALVTVVFAVYYPVTHNSFVTYDDNLYITENAHVKAGLTWATVQWAFTSYDESNWHPLTWLSHALDYQLFGPRPAGHHWVNVLLHATNAVLLFLLLLSATKMRWRSLMVAALFALHPINVESVAWAAERKNVLSMLFFLLALYAYEWYAREPEVRRYAAVAGFFALALLAKPQVITFPFLLLLWDYWPLNRIAALDNGSAEAGDLTKMRIGRLAWEKVPLLLLCAVSAVVTVEAQRAGGALRDLSRYGLLLRLETAVISYVRYLGKALWPSKLVAIYPHPSQLYPAWQVGGAAVLLIFITVLVLRARQQRYLAVGWFWFLGSLVPMIGLVQVGEQALADRYAYVSFIGLFIMIVWSVAEWAQARKISERWLAVPAVCCLLVLGILTHRQVRYWHDTESFWRRTLALAPDNYIANKGLAGLLYEQGKKQEAMVHVRAVLAVRPDDTAGNLILGDEERAHGNLPGAIQRYQTAALHAPGPSFRARSYANLGYAYRQARQPMKAKESFQMSLQSQPDQPAILVQLGLIAQIDESDPAAAVRDFSRAMSLQPTDVGLLLLANALIEDGKTAESNTVLERAERLSKNIDAAQKQAQTLVDGT
jgi:tetratricopeptide (TPR) repeat protein